MDAVSLDAMQARFAEHWSPKKIAQRHADIDEFLLVLDGQLTIQARDRDVVLGPRELFVVPRASSTARVPTPRPQCSCSNQARVVNTGDAGGELTAEVEKLA